MPEGSNVEIAHSLAEDHHGPRDSAPRSRWHTVLELLEVFVLAIVAVAAGALATYAARRMGPAPSPPVVTRFQLPLPEGQILALARRIMALSPDGRDIAFVTDNQLFVRRLAEFDAQQSKIVELRFFGGLTIEETAHVLGISPATVKREWTMAKAWLFNQLKVKN